MTEITYLPYDLKMREKTVKRKSRYNGAFTTLPGQDEFGYGKKIVTDNEIFYNNKWYRVYITCFSNAASHWIIVNKKIMNLP